MDVFFVFLLEKKKKTALRSGNVPGTVPAGGVGDFSRDS